jgi:hypothetical protein
MAARDHGWFPRLVPVGQRRGSYRPALKPWAEKVSRCEAGTRGQPDGANCVPTRWRSKPAIDRNERCLGPGHTHPANRSSTEDYAFFTWKNRGSFGRANQDEDGDRASYLAL